MHHLDGDHENDAPGNLVLIEHRDHMRLHGFPAGNRLKAGRGKGKRRGRIAVLPSGQRVFRRKGEHVATVIDRCEASRFELDWRMRAIGEDPHAIGCLTKICPTQTNCQEAGKCQFETTA